jgi:hypothetical protein
MQNDESPKTKFSNFSGPREFSNIGKLGIKDKYKKYVSFFDRAQITSSPILGLLGPAITRERLQNEILKKINNDLQGKGEPLVTFSDVFDESLMRKGGKTRRYKKHRKSKKQRKSKRSSK